ncbi:MAG: hypothetical protein AB8F74_06050, partial [Saprospiraceae bacterium]
MMHFKTMIFGLLGLLLPLISFANSYATESPPSDFFLTKECDDGNGHGLFTDASQINNTVTTCDLVNFNSQRLVWLNFENQTENQLFAITNGGAQLKEFADGTAMVTGSVVNVNDANDGYEFSVRLINKRDWSEWSALGRSFKGGNSPDNHPQWFYYELDNNNSVFTGFGNNAGQTINLSHAPSDFNYGFQIGNGANDKDADYGFSGWFNFSGSETGHGDFNGDLQNCVTTTPPTCNLNIDIAEDLAICNGSVDLIPTIGGQSSCQNCTTNSEDHSVALDIWNYDTNGYICGDYSSSTTQSGYEDIVHFADPIGNSNKKIKSITAVFNVAACFGEADDYAYPIELNGTVIGYFNPTEMDCVYG